MHNIRLVNINETFDLRHPENKQCLDCSSSALKVMTSFLDKEPLVISDATCIDNAQKLMMREHVKLKIVTDQNKKMIGAVTLTDLIGEKSLVMTKENGGRNEVMVSDVMTPMNELKAIPINEIQVSTVRDVVRVLKDSHIQHIFIADPENEKVVGLISASDITRKLSIPIKIDDGPTFHSIFKVL